MAVKLFISDMDGTLLNGESKISKKTAEVVKAVQGANIQWVMATGRSFQTTSSLLREAGISSDLVLLNGAEFRTASGTLIFKEDIENKTARKAVDILFGRGIGFEINTGDGDFSTDLELCSTASAFPEFLDFWKRNPEIRKIFAFSQDSVKLQETRDALSELEYAAVTSSAEWNIEITSILAQKGIMVEKVVEFYGISKEDVIVFGDGENDKTMFQKFPHSCAMENAIPSVKKLAEKVIGSNLEEGVANEVKRILIRR